MPPVLEIFQPSHLPQLRELMNQHLSAVVPGWALPEAEISRYLTRNPDQYVIDPWVVERQTLCVLERERVVAAAHLLRYGEGGEIGVDYQNACDIAWLVFWPEHQDAAEQLLSACHDQLRTWEAEHIYAWDSHLPAVVSGGIPDVWPHLHALFHEAGYRPNPDRDEAIFGGGFEGVAPPSKAPSDELTLKRSLKNDRGMCFSAMLGGQEVGWCQCVSDLTYGGARPAMRGWAELSELYIDEAWRRRGVGTWLVGHVVAWLQQAHCDRIVFSVARDDELAGAGAFYNGLGWNSFTRMQDGWRLVH